MFLSRSESSKNKNTSSFWINIAKSTNLPVWWDARVQTMWMLILFLGIHVETLSLMVKYNRGFTAGEEASEPFCKIGDVSILFCQKPKPGAARWQ